MRASVLASAAVFAFNCHKLMQMDNILCAAAIAVLICDPSALFQSGTQLSFLAYFIVSRFALFGHKQQQLSGLDRLIVDHQSAPVSAVGSVSRWLRSAARTSLVVWVTTLPFVLTSFQVSSWWSIPLTVCLTPPLIVALLSGLVSIAPLPECLTLITTDMSTYALRLINVTTAWCSTLPWSRILSAGTSPAALATLYTCMMASKTSWNPLLRRIAAVLFMLGYIGIMANTFVPAYTRNASVNKDALLIRFVSVGHGCCVLMTFPNGKTWMYDAGELGTGKKAAQSIQSVLWHAGISEVDTLFISHMDKDHFNATPYLLKSTTIRRCIVSDATMALSHKWKDLETLLLENGTKVETCSRSTQFNPCDHAVVRVLFTGLALQQTNDNARSMVLHVQFGIHSLLLAGDIEGIGLDILTRQAIKPIDVLLAPHHGSLHSEPERFAAWCRPRITVATTGRHSLPQRVTDAYTSQHDGRQSALLSTHRHGYVMVRLSQAGIHLEPMYPDGLGS